MPVVPLIAGTALTAGLVAWGLARRAERAEPHALDEPSIETDATLRHQVEAIAVLILGLVFVGALMFDAFDRQTSFARFDGAIAEFGASQATATTTAVLDVVTSLGGTRMVTALTVAVAVYALRATRSWWPVVYLTLVSGGQALVNNGIKMVVSRERPAISQLVDWSGASFPSGHAAAASAAFAGLAFVLIQRRSQPIRITLVAAAVFVAIAVAATRALLGVHWLTDVIAGLAVGWAWFLLMTALLGRRVSASFDTDLAYPEPVRP